MSACPATVRGTLKCGLAVLQRHANSRDSHIDASLSRRLAAAEPSARTARMSRATSERVTRVRLRSSRPSIIYPCPAKLGGRAATRDPYIVHTHVCEHNAAARRPWYSHHYTTRIYGTTPSDAQVAPLFRLVTGSGRALGKKRRTSVHLRSCQSRTLFLLIRPDRFPSEAVILGIWLLREWGESTARPRESAKACRCAAGNVLNAVAPMCRAIPWATRW